MKRGTLSYAYVEVDAASWRNDLREPPQPPAALPKPFAPVAARPAAPKHALWLRMQRLRRASGVSAARAELQRLLFAANYSERVVALREGVAESAVRDWMVRLRVSLRGARAHLRSKLRASPAA